jgi:hypothetical protein
MFSQSAAASPFAQSRASPRRGCPAATHLPAAAPARFEADLAEEIDFHREIKERDLARQGVPASQAAAAARRALGSAALAQDRSRDVWVWPWLDGIRYDLRLAFRGLRRDRAFTVAAIAMLALALGLNVSAFTIVRAMLFRGFPLVKQNDRLVYLQERYPSNVCCISYPDFEDWRAQAQTFDGLAYVGARDISFRDRDGRPLDTVAFTVSANTFGLLGVAPVLGRDFTPADEDAGAAPVVILNYRFWESRFGKDANVVGSIVHVSGEPATVIGIMPERFDFPTREDLWMPLTQTPQLWQRGLTPRGFTAVGRLRDGVTPQEARAEIETITAVSKRTIRRPIAI